MEKDRGEIVGTQRIKHRAERISSGRAGKHHAYFSRGQAFLADAVLQSAHRICEQTAAVPIYTSADHLLGSDYVVLKKSAAKDSVKHSPFDESDGYENLIRLLEENNHELLSEQSGLVIYKKEKDMRTILEIKFVLMLLHINYLLNDVERFVIAAMKTFVLLGVSFLLHRLRKFRK